MLYHLLTSIAGQSPWFLLLGYSIFRYYRYSAKRYPRPHNVSSKDYKAWREVESSGLLVPILGLIAGSLFTIMFIPKSQEQFINYSGIRSIAFIMGLIITIIIQIYSKQKAKQLGVLNTRKPTDINIIEDKAPNPIADDVIHNKVVDIPFKTQESFHHTCPHCNIVISVITSNYTDLITCPSCNLSFAICRPN